MCCAAGVDLSPNALGYIYLHRHHKRLWLLLGHSGSGQYYFCCGACSHCKHLPVGFLGYQALRLESEHLFPGKVWNLGLRSQGRCRHQAGRLVCVSMMGKF